MAIQELNKVEIESVSGGAAINVTNTLFGSLGATSSFLFSVLSAAKELVGSVLGVVTSLPLVGPKVSSLLGLVSKVVVL